MPGAELAINGREVERRACDCGKRKVICKKGEGYREGQRRNNERNCCLHCAARSGLCLSIAIECWMGSRSRWVMVTFNVFFYEGFFSCSSSDPSSGSNFTFAHSSLRLFVCSLLVPSLVRR